MATRALARRTVTPIIVNMPKRRQRFGRTRAVARRAGRSIARGASRAAIPTTMLMASAGLGYAQAKGMLNKLPTIGGSRAMTLGVFGYALTRLTTNSTARMVGSVAMLVGAFDFGSKQGGGKSALEGDDTLDGDDEI
jgi:hypothetical protein